MNRITLESTTFVSSKDGHETYGFRLYDDYDSTYDNNSEQPIVDDLELLEYMYNMTYDDDCVVAIIDFMIEHGFGIEINGSWYDYNDIKHIFGIE